ncbi:2-aminoethylphosphonate--pyruvate transaminase [Acidisphaera sp. L21]|uniref:2-aminoethylphosphonate--pyruvate transaminase n=1 Tax=Acidisphaera sp. L21 TaxID=1641851 RepID=UPI00131CA797|nr:2-aminoethylphosphonate--pyruvate transaminase [Acidisphaera sp. L21]
MQPILPTPLLLLTPGPLTTSDATRAALARDWGSRETDFIAMSEGVRARLVALAGVADTHVAVPLPGSGTHAVEAVVQTLVPRDGKLLVLVNGAYGHRMVAMARRLGRQVALLEAPEDQPIAPAAVAAALSADPAVTDVALVHCETTSGLLNPLEAVAAVVQAANRRFIIDAMSSFGAIPIDGAALQFSALVGSANKGLEGVPGLSYAIAEKTHLAASAGNASSVSLDLHDQWRGFESNRQWRFTPPVQVVAALAAALDQLAAEGGIAARHARYSRNCDVLLDGMQALGFVLFLPRALQAPVITTWHIPPGGWFQFDQFYEFLHQRGVIIYPGKLTAQPSFRIGCIGAIGPDDLARAMAEIGAFVRAYDPARSAA